MKTKRHARYMILASLAVVTAAALGAAMLVPGQVPGPSSTPAGAQTAVAPTHALNPTIELKQPDATSVPKAGWPVLPSQTLTVPLPEKSGCHHLVGNSWEEIPCATDEEMKDFPKPVLANSIQSTPHYSVLLEPLRTVTTPIVWGEVANQLHDPLAATETDPTWGPNLFSIQNNTNDFTCSPCKDGSPFPFTGLAGSASMPGDKGWVQFVYQQFELGPPGPWTWPPTPGIGNGRMCVWNVDITVAHATGNIDGYLPVCVFPSSSSTILPLTGAGAPEGISELIGYVKCPFPGSNVGCTLWALAYLPTAGGWYAISSPDHMGLAGKWFNVSGTIYGAGGGSEAVFTDTMLSTNLAAYSCDASPVPSVAQPCPPGDISAEALFLTGTPASVVVTGETNNLTNGPVVFSCGDYDCLMSYFSLAP